MQGDIIKSISVVIPAYNEEKRIKKTLDKTIKYLEKKKFDYELIIVNDCSKDKTAKLVESINNKRLRLLNNKSNKGKGYSVKRGMLSAKKKWVLFSDADLSTPIEMLDKMWPHTKQFDVVIASRNMPDSNIGVKQPWYRQMAGKAFPLFVRAFLLRGIKDTQCGFKLFKTSIVKSILKKQTLDGWAFDAELLFIAKKTGYNMKEVGVEWVNDENSKLNLIRDSLQMGKDVLKIRLNQISGKY